MVRLFRIAVVSCTLSMFASCSSDKNPVSPQDLQGSGNPVSETRTVASFQSLAFETVGEVRITKGAAQSVKVTVDDNLIEYLETTISNGNLSIDFDKSIDPDNFDLLVELTMTDLNAITMTGVGTVRANAMSVDDLVVTLTGVGDVYVDVTGHLTAVITGVGSVHYTGSPQVNATITGIGQVIDDN